MKRKLLLGFWLLLTSAGIWAAAPYPIAEEIVEFKSDAFGCLTKDALNQAMVHVHKKETTLAKEMFEKNECFSISKNTKWKVLSTDYKWRDHPLQIKSQENLNVDIRLWIYAEFLNS
jgi:hypothetical protein